MAADSADEKHDSVELVESPCKQGVAPMSVRAS